MIRRYLILGASAGEKIAEGLLLLEGDAKPFPMPQDNKSAMPQDDEEAAPGDESSEKHTIVSLGDVNYEEARNAVDRLVTALYPHSRSKGSDYHAPSVHCEAVELDTQGNGIDVLFQHFDVVVNTLGVLSNAILVKMAVEKGLNLCCLNGVPDGKEGLETINSIAQEKGISVVFDCGSPRATAVIAKMMVEGKTKLGVHIAEDAFEQTVFLEELNRILSPTDTDQI